MKIGLIEFEPELCRVAQVEGQEKISSIQKCHQVRLVWSGRRAGKGAEVNSIKQCHQVRLPAMSSGDLHGHFTLSSIKLTDLVATKKEVQRVLTARHCFA